MTPLPLDQFEGLEKALGLDDESIQQNLADLADAARAKWVALAGERLRSTARGYQGCILPVQYPIAGRGWVALIVLENESPEGRFANMIEQGAQGWDLRETLLKGGGHVRHSKAGYAYASIPFGLHSPGASGRNAAIIGEPYGDAGLMSPGDALSFGRQLVKQLGRQVAAAERNSRAGYTTSTPGGGTRWGSRLPEAQAGPLLRARHAAPVYAGMYRFGKGYESAFQSTHGTFRTISMNPGSYRFDEGNPNASAKRFQQAGANWWHPGFEARNLVSEVESYVRDVAPQFMGQ